MAMLKCEKCGRMLDEKQFYTYKDGTKDTMCKQCLTMFIDLFEPSSFEWILKRMDVPYIPGEWNILVQKQYQKDPNKVVPGAVFGKYLSKMKLRQWKKYGYADSQEAIDFSNGVDANREAMAQQSIENIQQIEDDYLAGRISKEEYMTRTSPAALPVNKKDEVDMDALKEKFFNDTHAAVVDAPQFMDEDEVPELVAELTDEDKKYLLLKWGRMYKPSQWIELERNYRQMEESFDIQDQDTRNSLILSCKTYLKANEALDVGDVASYNSLMAAYDKLRKSSKFTAAQNKEEKGEFVDCIGTAVLFCEQEMGKINRHDVSVNPDIFDKVIEDLKGYTKSLIESDPALAREIDNYLKRKIAAEETYDAAQAAADAGLDTVPITDEDMAAFKAEEEAQRAADALIEGGVQDEFE